MSHICVANKLLECTYKCTFIRIKRVLNVYTEYHTLAIKQGVYEHRVDTKR